MPAEPTAFFVGPTSDIDCYTDFAEGSATLSAPDSAFLLVVTVSTLFKESTCHMRANLPLEKCWKLLNHGPVSLITSAHAGKTNVMAASWVMTLDYNPPKVLLVLDANSYSRTLVDASGEFGLQIPKRRIAEMTVAVGQSSGRDMDKFDRFNIRTFPAQIIAAPMLEDCVGWMECKVIPDATQRYDLFIAEVVASYADSKVFHDNDWDFGDDPLERTMHYISNGEFFATGERFRVPVRQ
jgi:flavin reductase (DIM6/NTAB) family NADH-FMN oxidoreductase RutF